VEITTSNELSLKGNLSSVRKKEDFFHIFCADKILSKEISVPIKFLNPIFFNKLKLFPLPQPTSNIKESLSIPDKYLATLKVPPKLIFFTSFFKSFLLLNFANLSHSFWILIFFFQER